MKHKQSAWIFVLPLLTACGGGELDTRSFTPVRSPASPTGPVVPKGVNNIIADGGQFRLDVYADDAFLQSFTDLNVDPITSRTDPFTIAVPPGNYNFHFEYFILLNGDEFFVARSKTFDLGVTGAEQTASLADLTLKTPLPDSDNDGVADIDELEAWSDPFAPPVSQTDLPGSPGVVRVSLIWDSTDDLDLSVIDPCGNEVDFSTPSAVCFEREGKYEFDANADDGNLSETPAENVFWQSADNLAPAGDYRVLVVQAKDRTPARTTQFIVHIFIGDQLFVRRGRLDDGGWEFTFTVFEQT